jgi:hypothetical protein
VRRPRSVQHRGCKSQDIGLVRWIDGVSLAAAVETLTGAKLGLPQRTDCSIRKQPDRTFKQREDKSPGDTRGLALWRASIDPRGTLVERYLKFRALDLPNEAANEAIRFHPDCPFMDERFPAMICLVRNIVSNEPQAVHRTALAADGTAVKRNGKTFRMSLGSISGGAIKLAQYQGAPSRRAKQLADRYRSYLAAGWLHERDLEILPRSNALGRTRAGLLC